jgi:hypothetical protein
VNIKEGMPFGLSDGLVSSFTELAGGIIKITMYAIADE